MSSVLFPTQGHWTEEDYLALNTNRLIELSEGCLEVLPVPTPFQQRIVQFLFKYLKAWVLAHARGEVFLAPLCVRLWVGKIRQPDVVYVCPGRISSDPHRPPEGADLAMEVVSGTPEDRKRDLEVKRYEYAQARIAEYWIVDPREQRVTVLTLDGTDYRVHGEFSPGTQATSVLFPGFTVDVAAAFAAGEGPPQTTRSDKNGE